MEAKSKGFRIDKKFVLIAGIVAVICIIAACAFIATGNGQRRLNSLLDTGDRYLSELDYEQAVAAYLAAIEIDPKCEDAYLGLAGAYVAMGNLDGALEILGEGYKLTASGRMAAMMKEISWLLGQRNGLSWANAGLEDHVMEWDDEGLEKGMRAITGIKEGDIMLSDVWEMTVLDLSNLNIINIASLGELANLTTLSLDYNKISDFSLLSSLNNLTALSLDHNQISNISPLSSLNNLTYLYLDSNEISDISPLSSLNNLTYLCLISNQISDISPLSSLINLTGLYLDANQISDISPLSSLNSITELSLSYNQISDVSPLSSLTNLTKVYLDSNQISDVSPLSSLSNLTYLDLRENNITDYSPLDHFAEGVVHK